ncbi:MAG TPA: AraD1 family protein [Chitinophagaceae bacterium]|nr:AraD1 family protein [Chitinophagaceae bacterium]
MKENTRLVQIAHPERGRKIAVVAEPFIILLKEFTSVYYLALKAIDSGKNIHSVIETSLSNDKLEYDAVYNGLAEWKLLPSFDYPDISSNCLVSGTGLTHKNSALNRQMMHQAETGNTLTDSMKIYRLGLDGGQPEKGKIGVQPEWFYKGTGAILKGHGQSLSVPNYGNDGGEEPEIAGIYIIDRKGDPVRIGFTTANEFSDHVMEKKNYLYLAPSKLRNCSIGPELVLTNDFTNLKGTVKVMRKQTELWSAAVHTGESNMAHSLANLEYHHFKYADHRQPLQAHVHFFGADAFSFGAGIRLQTEDEMHVQWEGMGRPLVNTIKIEIEEESLIRVKTF